MSEGITDEPVPAAPEAAEAGSFVVRDLLRALVCSLLVAGCVTAPDSAPLVAPFVPALVALRLVRRREGAARFLLTTTGLSLLAAALGSSGLDAWQWLAVLVACLGLTAGLGWAHVRASRLDPIDAPQQAEWPEPRIDTGFSLALGAWVLFAVLLAGALAPSIDSLRDTGRRIVDDAYSTYTDGCAEGGALEQRDDFCDSVLQQRDSLRTQVDDNAPELLALLLSGLAFGSAATAHLVVLLRGRRSGARIRPSWRLQELEVHWSAAYLVAAGAITWVATAGSELVFVRSLAVGVGSLGAFLVVTQGLGLVAWLLSRRASPRWYRALLVVLALLVVPVTLVALFTLGVVDMALHPRRKARASGNVAGRGSGG